MLIATGITFLIAMQVVINLGVVTGALPNKGLALPFISYGGSNLVIMLGCVGLLINIGRHAGDRLPHWKAYREKYPIWFQEFFFGSNKLTNITTYIRFYEMP
jgi:hypothetical protein